MLRKLRRQFLLIFVAYSFTAMPVSAYQLLPANGQSAIPSEAEGLFLIAGSFCDHQYNNLDQYIPIYSEKGDNYCGNSTFYIKNTALPWVISITSIIPVVIYFIFKNLRSMYLRIRR